MSKAPQEATGCAFDTGVRKLPVLRGVGMLVRKPRVLRGPGFFFASMTLAVLTAAHFTCETVAMAKRTTGGGGDTRSAGDGRRRLGTRGEDAAVLHLEALGYEILARNWRSRFGELDAVALDGDIVVFVEVKLRYDPIDPLAAVDARKQQHLSRLAFDFLTRHGMLDRSARFDVIAVEGRTLACTHVLGAFDSTVEY